MYQSEYPKRVENYTNACLVLIFVNMLWIFGVIWVKYGLVAVILTGWAVHHMINYIDRRKTARDAALNCRGYGLNRSAKDR